jgi:hypothetical protein
LGGREPALLDGAFDGQTHRRRKALCFIIFEYFSGVLGASKSR